MSFFNTDEDRTLDMNISSFRRRVTDAIRLGNFQAGGGLELTDKELKINQEYEEFRRHWTKANP